MVWLHTRTQNRYIPLASGWYIMRAHRGIQQAAPALTFYPFTGTERRLRDSQLGTSQVLQGDTKSNQHDVGSPSAVSIVRASGLQKRHPSVSRAQTAVTAKTRGHEAKIHVKATHQTMLRTPKLPLQGQTANLSCAAHFWRGSLVFIAREEQCDGAIRSQCLLCASFPSDF